MKKVIVILSMFVFALAGNVSAQGERPVDQLSLNFVKVDGANTVRLPDGRGSIKFVARGDKFSKVEFTNAAGQTTRLTPNSGGTAGAPKQPCPYPIPDACFGTANKSIGMCMCHPTDISAGGDPNAILIDVLLPPKKISAANR